MSPLLVTNSLFQGNTAGTSGGAIDNARAGTRLEFCTVRDNHALAGNGGGVSGGSWTVVECSNVDFDGNTATLRGGAIYSLGVSALQTSWLNNCAGTGGALYCYADTRSTIDHGSFVGNTASIGPSIYIETIGIITLNCTEVDLAECAGGPFDDPYPPYSEVRVTADGCVVASESMNWGNLKALYR